MATASRCTRSAIANCRLHTQGGLSQGRRSSTIRYRTRVLCSRPHRCSCCPRSQSYRTHGPIYKLIRAEVSLLLCLYQVLVSANVLSRRNILRCTSSTPSLCAPLASRLWRTKSLLLAARNPVVTKEILDQAPHPSLKSSPPQRYGNKKDFFFLKHTSSLPRPKYMPHLTLELSPSHASATLCWLWCATPSNISSQPFCTSKTLFLSPQSHTLRTVKPVHGSVLLPTSAAQRPPPVDSLLCAYCDTTVNTRSLPSLRNRHDEKPRSTTPLTTSPLLLPKALRNTFHPGALISAPQSLHHPPPQSHQLQSSL